VEIAKHISIRGIEGLEGRSKVGSDSNHPVKGSWSRSLELKESAERVRGLSVKLEDRHTTAATEVEARGPQGATASFASEDLDPGRERRPWSPISRRSVDSNTPSRGGGVSRQGARSRDGSPAGGALSNPLLFSPRGQTAWDDLLRALAHRGEALRVEWRTRKPDEIAARVERACEESCACFTRSATDI